MNLLGIDFEDWYHPELIQKYVKDKKHDPIMFKGLDKILELLRKNNVLATFFVVGELVESNPEIFDKITENEHEIAFHTMHHTKIDTPNFKENFHNEIEKFSELTNKKSKGFRAPTFSLNKKSSWIIDSLYEHNYLYDSSVVPAKTDLYGIPDAETKPYRISSSSIERDTEDGKLIEFPLLVTKFLGKKIPAGGGFYLRTLPTKIIKNAIKNYEKQEIPATFYIHSWELTPEYMPKIELPFKENFVTYHNINKAYERMDELLMEFQFTAFSQYISNGPKFSNQI
jgi:polysaccharide deacetylase family protein (PEP-CTERM system associated)